jgi:acyl-CoA carboxylase subunit beta
MPTLTTTVDPRSSGYADRRQVMLAHLDVLDETLSAARRRVRARERVELLLDRDAPFLELHPVAGSSLVGGIGQVEGAGCVVVAHEPGALEGTGDRDKAYRLAGIAAEHGLPLVHLAEPGRTWRELARAGTVIAVAFGPDSTPLGDFTIAVGTAEADFAAESERDALRLARLCVRRLNRAPVPDSGPTRPPAYEPDDLLGTVDAREILARLLDASEFDEFQPGGDLVAGWGELYGYPLGILAGDLGESTKAARFVELVRDGGTPLLYLHTAPGTGQIPPPDLAVNVTVAGGRAYRPRLLLGWAGSGAEADAVIDPRDTRAALGLALSVTGRLA